MDTSLLKAAIHAIKSGDKANGQRLLTELVKSEPNNELAWLWLSVCFEDPQKKKYCLNRTLAINPANPNARRALEQLERPATGTPTNAAVAVAPRQPSASAPEPLAAVQAVANPAESVSVAPAKPSPSSESKEKQKRKSRWPLYLLLVILILLVCLGGGFFAIRQVFGLLNSQISGQFHNVYRALVTQSESTPQNFSQIGVFLLEGSDTLELARTTEAPPLNLPATQNKRPALILNDPQINISELVFAAVDGKTVLEQIPLQSQEYQGAVLVTPGQDLENGVYCLIQYLSTSAPGLEPRWCFQVGQTVGSAPSEMDPTNLNVAPPGDGFFLIEQGQAIALPVNTQEKLEISNLPSLPSTANRQPVIIVKSADIDFTQVKWNESLWGVGIREISTVDPGAPGASIGTVIDGTPASRANLRSQDILLTINGQPLDTGASGRIDNYNRLRGLPGTLVEITVQQGTQVLELQLPRTILEDYREIEYKVIQKIGYVYLVPNTNLRPNIYYLKDDYHGREMYFQIR